MYIKNTHTHAQVVARGSGFKFGLKNPFFISKARKPNCEPSKLLNPTARPHCERVLGFKLVINCKFLSNIDISNISRAIAYSSTPQDLIIE